MITREKRRSEDWRPLPKVLLVLCTQGGGEQAIVELGLDPRGKHREAVAVGGVLIWGQGCKGGRVMREGAEGRQSETAVHGIVNICTCTDTNRERNRERGARRMTEGT